jgi:hypothetical protein
MRCGVVGAPRPATINSTSVAIACSTSSCAFESSGVISCSGHTTRTSRVARLESSRQIAIDPNHSPAGVLSIGNRNAGLPPNRARSSAIKSLAT